MRANTEHATTPALYWSRTGEICCAKHAPHRMSDTWIMYGWKKMRPDEIEALHAEGCEGCETCTDNARRERDRGQS